MLTEQRKLFVDEYIRLHCKHKKQAAINAGYSPKTAGSQATAILKDAEVLEYFELRKSQLRSEIQQEFLFSASEAQQTMYDIMNDPSAEDKDKIAVCKDFLDRAGFGKLLRTDDDSAVSNYLQRLFGGGNDADS